mgnify:CR=1 FL=1
MPPVSPNGVRKTTFCGNCEAFFARRPRVDVLSTRRRGPHGKHWSAPIGYLRGSVAPKSLGSRFLVELDASRGVPVRVPPLESVDVGLPKGKRKISPKKGTAKGDLQVWRQALSAKFSQATLMLRTPLALPAAALPVQEL